MNKKSLTAAAQAVTDKFFTKAEEQQEVASEASQTAQEGREAVQVDKPKGNDKDAHRGVTRANKAVKVFSFRGTVQDVNQWRLYASIRGAKVDDIGVAAMREYLKRHPLSAEEKALFDKRIESMKP